MKEGLYLLNETLRKGLFEIFKPVNDPTLVWKMSPEVRKGFDGLCRVGHIKLKSLNICKLCN
jgi:hypothetical protein